MSFFKIRRLQTLGLLLLVSILMYGCNQSTEKNIPPLTDQGETYLNFLTSGDKESISDIFFMPLHEKDIKHLITTFNQEHKALVANNLSLTMKMAHQRGRWGLLIVNKAYPHGKAQLEAIWFFYYRKKWRVISPEIYRTKEVRAMMNVYPEYAELKKWLPKMEGEK